MHSNMFAKSADLRVQDGNLYSAEVTIFTGIFFEPVTKIPEKDFV